MDYRPRPSTWPGDSEPGEPGGRGLPPGSAGGPRPGSGRGVPALPRLPGFPYEVVRPLGRGGMGIVYEVRTPGDPRRLAAKLLTLTSDHARARFEREGQLVARLEHPGVIPVIASGTLSNGTPYLIFEFVDGRSLRDLLQEAEEPLDEDTVLRWGEELARALGSAHALGIVHRDVKPANVMIDAAGRVRIADFGIALAADLDRLTKTGQLAGTPLYMAPEQFAPDRPIGPWTDVHAVGSVLFEALAGHAPFDAPTGPNIVASILNAEAPSVRSVRRDVSAGLASVIARCLEKDPSRRYADGNALAEDLARLRRGERISAVSRLLRAARRRLLRRTTTVGVAVALVAAVPAVGLFLAHRGSVARERAETATALAADLNALAARLRPDASELALRAAAQDLERARAVLVDLPEGPARAHLQEAVDRLAERRALALADGLARAAMKEARALAPETLGRALEALAAVPPATPAPHDADAWAREEARAWLLYLAGRLEEARATASRLAPDERAPSWTDPDEWLAEPARRAAWLACWCALRLGDAEELERRSRELPAALRARLLAVGASVAAEPEQGRAAARAALGDRTSGPAAELVLAELAVDELLRTTGSVDLGRALEVLLAVRRLAWPGSPARVPRAVQAHAALLEGELHLAIGWPASAAEAFSRARRVATDAGPPVDWPAAALTLPVAGGRRRVLLAPDTAARAGEALARALCPDPAAAVAAAAAACDRASLDHPALAAERLQALRAALAGRAPPDPTSPAALQLAGAWPPLIEDLAASAEADLAAASIRARQRSDASGEGGAPAPDADPAPLRERALRAARLAATLEGGAGSVRVQATLARAEAAAGDRAAASAALERARALAPRAVETLAAAAHVALSQGRSDAAVDAGRAAVEALAAQDRRLIERGELTQALLRPLIDALERGGHHVDALTLIDLASRCADRDRLRPEVRAALHERLAAAARALGRKELVREAAARSSQLIEQAARLNRASRVIAAQVSHHDGQFADSPELREAYELLMRENPHRADTYIGNHMVYGRLRAEGFDNLALAFECHADAVVDYLNSPSFAPRHMGKSAAEAAMASILLLTDAASPDPSLPVPRDEHLRRALAGLYCAELRIPLEPPRLAACLAAAREAWGRRPMSEPASLLLGRLLIVAGAPADALPPLTRARDLPPLASPDRPRAGCWRPLYEALACAALRDLERTRAALAEARERRLTLSHRVREEPLFWEDQALPGTLYPWAAEVATEIEATYGAR